MPSYTNAIPFFNNRYLPTPEYAYVVWLDVMGIGERMSRSLGITSNFIFKLHIAVLDSPNTDMQLYPVMDGIYAVAPRQNVLTRFLEGVFSRLADTFVSEPEIQHRFVVKAAVAYGPVIHGNKLPRDASHILGDRSDYRGSILLGMPMIQAFQFEREAPPFGVYIHESARAFAPQDDTPFTYSWWHWYSRRWRELAIELQKELDRYYNWCKERASSIGYEEEKIEQHWKMANQYLIDVPPLPTQLPLGSLVTEVERDVEDIDNTPPSLPIQRPRRSSPPS